jgi:hypothetical protein
MATDIVQSLFGVTPDMYQQQQAAQADARALQFARLTPMQQAQYGIGRGAYGLAGAIGGALGAQDPELQRISMRQQIAAQLRPDDLSTFDQGIEMMRQAGDGQGALMLQMERDKARQLAIVRQDEALVRQDQEFARQKARAQRSQEEEAFFRKTEAQAIAREAFVPEVPSQEQFVEVDFRGQPVPVPGVPASFDISRVAPRLMQTTEGLAELDKLRNAQTFSRKEKVNDLASRIRNPDGTFNQTVINELQGSPEGLAAITAQANVLPSLRKLGAAGTKEVDPFTPFLTDATIPTNVKTYAQQLSSSFASGTLDPEKVDAKVKELSEMTQRAQQFEQNQEQIKSNQAIMQSLRQQGLENSRQGLLIQQGNQLLAQQNAQFQQDMKKAEADRKAEERKNRPLPGYLAKEEEADFSAASAASNIATDAYGYINRIKTGEIKFGLKDRASIRARQLFGSGDTDVIAREEYDKFVTNLVNESLRLNKGTQTEGDAVREAKALQSSESKEAAASAMKRLVEINTRRVEGAVSSVEKRRANAGFPSAPQPIAVPKFDVQIITPAEYDRFLKNPKFPSGTVFVDPDGIRRVKP